MEYILIAIMVGIFVIGCLMGYYANHDINFAIKYENHTIKRENERLNAELKILTDRDEYGRFVKNENN